MFYYIGLRYLGWLSVGTVVVALAVATIVAIQVDDWGRDLVTNVAATAWTATDPDLRPVAVELSPAATAALIASVGDALPRWAFVRRAVTDSMIELQFVRTTRIFRFRDDVTVTVTDHGDHREVNARSASRLGTGDLGQNPRNLRELTRALRARLEGQVTRGTE